MKNIFTLALLLMAYSAFSNSFDSSRYFFEKGMEEKSSKRYLVASGHFNKAIKLNPNYTEAYVENGLVNKEMRRTDEAKQNFTKAYELDNNNDIAIAELMELYFSYRQYQQAIEFAQKCKSCTDKDRIIALSYFQTEDYAKAEKLLLNLIVKNPTDAILYYTMAKNYLEMGLELKSIPYYEKAVLLDKTKGIWQYELGLLYFNNKKFKEAVVSINSAIDLGYTRNNDVNENLGFAYLFSGDVENGEKLLGEIIARKPGDKELIMDVANALYDAKFYDLSLAYCQKILELDMKDGKALYQAGLCFQKKGQTERGMQMCDKAIELDPSLAGLKSKKLSRGM